MSEKELDGFQLMGEEVDIESTKAQFLDHFKDTNFKKDILDTSVGFNLFVTVKDNIVNFKCGGYGDSIGMLKLLEHIKEKTQEMQMQIIEGLSKKVIEEFKNGK